MKALRLLPTIGSSVSRDAPLATGFSSDVSLQPTLEKTRDKTFSLKRTLACIQDSGKEFATYYTTFHRALEITNRRSIVRIKKDKKL